MKLRLYLFFVLILGVAYQVIITKQFLTPGVAQLLSLVLILALFLKLEINQQCITKGLLGVSLLIATTWYVVISKKPDLFDAQYYLANFVDDLHGKESRKFLQDLNFSWPKASNAKIYKINNSVSNYQDAQDLLLKKNQAKVVLWGNEKELSIVIAPPYNISLNELALTKELHLGLKLVTDVPMVRIFRNPHDATVDFVAGLLAAINQPTELKWRTVGAVSQVWHSSIHLAYLRFKLGNHLFLELLNNSEGWQEARFKCIFKEYRRAAYYVRKATHPELATAINNNIALLKYLKVLFKSKKWTKKISQRFKSAKSLKAVSNPMLFPYQAVTVVEWNFKLIKELHTKKRLMKAKKKKHEI